MLPPEQRYFLRRNLQLKLESARLALLLDNSNAWSASLNEAAEWTRRYFDSNDAGVKEALATLDRLAGTNLLPPLPDLSSSRVLLQKLSRKAASTSSAVSTEQPKATPVKPKPAPKPAAVKPAPAPAPAAAEAVAPAVPTEPAAAPATAEVKEGN